MSKSAIEESLSRCLTAIPCAPTRSIRPANFTMIWERLTELDSLMPTMVRHIESLTERLSPHELEIGVLENEQQKLALEISQKEALLAEGRRLAGELDSALRTARAGVAKFTNRQPVAERENELRLRLYKAEEAKKIDELQTNASTMSEYERELPGLRLTNSEKMTTLQKLKAAVKPLAEEKQRCQRLVLNPDAIARRAADLKRKFFNVELSSVEDAYYYLLWISLAFQEDVQGRFYGMDFNETLMPYLYLVLNGADEPDEISKQLLSLCSMYNKEWGTAVHAEMQRSYLGSQDPHIAILRQRIGALVGEQVAISTEECTNRSKLAGYSLTATYLASQHLAAKNAAFTKAMHLGAGALFLGIIYIDYNIAPSDPRLTTMGFSLQAVVNASVLMASCLSMLFGSVLYKFFLRQSSPLLINTESTFYSGFRRNWLSDVDWERDSMSQADLYQEYLTLHKRTYSHDSEIMAIASDIAPKSWFSDSLLSIHRKASMFYIAKAIYIATGLFPINEDALLEVTPMSRPASR